MLQIVDHGDRGEWYTDGCLPRMWTVVDATVLLLHRVVTTADGWIDCESQGCRLDRS